MIWSDGVFKVEEILSKLVSCNHHGRNHTFTPLILVEMLCASSGMGTGEVELDRRQAGLREFTM